MFFGFVPFRLVVLVLFRLLRLLCLLCLLCLSERLYAVFDCFRSVQVVHDVCVADGPVHLATVRAPRCKLSAHFSQLASGEGGILDVCH